MSIKWWCPMRCSKHPVGRRRRKKQAREVDVRNPARRLARTSGATVTHRKQKTTSRKEHTVQDARAEFFISRIGSACAADQLHYGR